MLYVIESQDSRASLSDFKPHAFNHYIMPFFKAACPVSQGYELSGRVEHLLSAYNQCVRHVLKGLHILTHLADVKEAMIIHKWGKPRPREANSLA